MCHASNLSGKRYRKLRHRNFKTKVIVTLLNSSIKVETDSFSLDIARAEMVEEMESIGI